ncbi:hypothetical protein CC80DRAFT_430775 [Byssothecium circinans]|uniref:AttH domain-containing protein n=1 Tax=Byssothecium circinans TaxID=147558 RepID=A0A6A5T820_9PLEO|nr:hypothetical protein CC80DRAFT_430775 [Byssothecium circinans]
MLLAVGVAAVDHPKPHCSIDTQAAGTYLNGSVPMNDNPWTHFDAPMTKGFNLTNGEDWSFEGASADGQSGMGFTFSRGTVAGNTAAQRMFIAVVWPNGTRFMESSFADTSTVEACKDLTKGTWYNATSGMNWTFEASKDFKRTVVTAQSTTVQGTITLDAISPAVYPNGLVYPHTHGDNLFAPHMYWVENVAVGVVSANLTIRGTPFVLKGIGGRERNWNDFAWAKVSTRWDMIRAKVGPYTAMAWTFDSRVDGKTYFSGVVMEGKKVLFRTLTQEVSKTKNYGSLSLRNNGAVRLSSDPSSAMPLPESRHTGYLLELVEPKTGKQWRFEADYTKCVYWFPAGLEARLGGFVGSVRGGLVGGPQHSGLISGTAMEHDI